MSWIGGLPNLRVPLHLWEQWKLLGNRSNAPSIHSQHMSLGMSWLINIDRALLYRASNGGTRELTNLSSKGYVTWRINLTLAIRRCRRNWIESPARPQIHKYGWVVHLLSGAVWIIINITSWILLTMYDRLCGRFLDIPLVIYLRTRSQYLTPRQTDLISVNEDYSASWWVTFQFKTRNCTLADDVDSTTIFYRMIRTPSQALKEEKKVALRGNRTPGGSR
jgi:hypothetical protein